MVNSDYRGGGGRRVCATQFGRLNFLTEWDNYFGQDWMEVETCSLVGTGTNLPPTSWKFKLPDFVGVS